MGKTEIKCEKCKEREKSRERLARFRQYLLGAAGLTIGMLGFVMSTVTLIVASRIESLWISSCIQYSAVLAIFLEVVFTAYGGSELVKWAKKCS